ncbi:MAG: ATPase domain-containing protein, partial [Fervidobacterium sp.]
MANNENEKEQALKLAMMQVEKEFGKGAVMRLGDKKSAISIESIPTGIMSLDLALGVGGFPRGRIVEIFGPEGSGKTTLALEAVASAQRQ